MLKMSQFTKLSCYTVYILYLLCKEANGGGFTKMICGCVAVPICLHDWTGVQVVCFCSVYCIAHPPHSHTAYTGACITMGINEMNVSSKLVQVVKLTTGMSAYRG